MMSDLEKRYGITMEYTTRVISWADISRGFTTGKEKENKEKA